MSISKLFHNFIAAAKLDISAEEAKIIAEFQKAETDAHQELLAAIANITQRVSNLEDAAKSNVISVKTAN